MKKNLKWRGKKLTKKVSNFSKKTAKTSKEHLRDNFFNRLSNVKNVRLLILEWILLILIILLLSIAQSFWYDKSYSNSSFTSGGTYIEATLGKVSSLNPLLAKTNSEKALAKLMFSSLVTVDYSGHIGPDLAKSIKHDDKAKVWTIELKDDLKWSDNTPLTSEDVIFTIETIKNNLLDTLYTAKLSHLKVTKKDNSIIFTLPSSYSDFSSVLDFPILPAHILKNSSAKSLAEHEFNSKPISSGPFTYRATQNTSNSDENIIHLTANPYYHRGRPLLDSFSIYAAISPDTIISSLKNNTITATSALSSSQLPKDLPSNIYKKQTTIKSGTLLFLNNLTLSKSLRKTLSTAIDLRSLRAPLESSNQPPLNLPFIDQKQNFQPFVFNYNPEEAKKHLPKDHKIRLVSVNSGSLPALAENLEFQLKNLGLKPTLSIHEPNQEFIKNVLRPRDYDLLIYELDLGSTIDLFPYFHSSQISESGLNLANYNNPFVDDIILATRANPSAKFRNLKYSTLLTYLLDDVPVIPIAQSNLTYLFNQNTRNFSEDNQLSDPLDRFNDVIRWSSLQTQKHRTP